MEGVRGGGCGSICIFRRFGGLFVWRDGGLEESGRVYFFYRF